MDTLTALLIVFLWTLLAFWFGVVTHWWATRKQRRLLKRYREHAQMQRIWGSPVE